MATLQSLALHTSPLVVVLYKDAPYLSSVEKFTKMSGAVIAMEWIYFGAYKLTIDVVEGHMFKFLLVFIFVHNEDY
jgi:hypothetical protein